MSDEIKTYEDLQKRIKELEHDLSIREHIDKTLLFLSQHGWEDPRESFFHSLARFLAETLEMDYVCIDKLHGNLLEAETFAIYYDGKFEDNVSYTLNETPCGEVVGKQICCFSQDVRHLFKKDIILQEMNAESYIGTTLWNSKNEPIGLIAVIGRKRLENSNFAETILKLAAVRASGELERINAEQALMDSERMFKSYYNTNPTSTFVWTYIDNDLMLTDFNETANKSTNYLASNYLGLSTKQIYPDLPFIREKLLECYNTQSVVEFDYLYQPRTKNAQEWLRFKLAYMEPNKVLLFDDNITEQKKAEAVLKENEQELIKINEEKDHFISIIAHDLKSPFNTLLGFSELLSKNLRSYSIEKTETQINIIYDIAKRTYNLLDDILIWARLQTGRLSFSPQKQSFTDVCEQVIDNLEMTASLKNISINSFSASEIAICADKNMLNTILRNLVSNAIKFTNRNGQINIYAEQNGTEVTITVSDDGIGIDPNIQKKLFDNTHKITTVGTANETGTGLGLILCKEFVERHKGRIWVESEPGNGSEFKFTMPLYEL